MPDDAFWKDLHPPPDVPRDVPSLEAEVRRLRGVLLRVRDQLAGAKSWEELRTAVRAAGQEAEKALSLPQPRL